MNSPTRPSHQPLINGLGWFGLALGAAELAAPRTVVRAIGLPDDPRVLSIVRAFGARGLVSGFGMLAQPDRAGWLWSRVAGDAVDLAFLSSAVGEDSVDRTRITLAVAAVAGIAALDVICARALQDRRRQGSHGDLDADEVSVERSVTVNKPIDQVYGFWKRYENLPRFMRHLESVETLDGTRSRWTAKGPAGMRVTWEADTIADRANEWIAWQSLEGADVDNRGSVRFQRAPGDRGTEVRVHVQYRPPAGRLGRGIAWLFGEEPGQQVREDLRRFKALMETGQIPLSEGPGLWRAARPPQSAKEMADVAGVEPGIDTGVRS